MVGTSREKCAFYIIGNAEFLGKNSPFLWKVHKLSAMSCLNVYVFSTAGVNKARSPGMVYWKSRVTTFLNESDHCLY